ncbi:hypothetical protein DM01DRAFT_316802 [Hesseltinella vesiculosa]|uniref:Uncharacterized protein n=1 Tax=Hesseltinella vesiculosa TaxID=101127 RepID=A0A1X2GGF4_9FUNG|nr:hypothetical protein DM01DRAFT_316802 [Hesseltinella vesiculosa]
MYMGATPEDVKSFVLSILRGVTGIEDLKQVVKSNKVEQSQVKPGLCGAEGYTEVCSWYIISSPKQFRGAMNRMESKQTEYNFIMTFLHPLLERLLRHCQNIDVMWGEQSLSASKEMDNWKLLDSDRRSNGSSIDCIMTHVPTGMEVAVVEVSGPPAQSQHSHYVGDRTKIAVNLKKIMKKILGTYSNANPAALSKIAPIGLQVYNHDLFVYVLTMSAYGLYAFTKVDSVRLPVKPIKSSRVISQLTMTLWKVAIRMSQMEKLLEQCAVDYDSNDDQSLSDFSSAENSPQRIKKQKAKR